jgi:hypothetical protein
MAQFSERLMSSSSGMKLDEGMELDHGVDLADDTPRSPGGAVTIALDPELAPILIDSLSLSSLSSISSCCSKTC